MEVPSTTWLAESVPEVHPAVTVSTNRPSLTEMLQSYDFETRSKMNYHNEPDDESVSPSMVGGGGGWPEACVQMIGWVIGEMIRDPEK